MGQEKLAGIAVGDIGKIAYGIFRAGAQYVGKTVGIMGEALTVKGIRDRLSHGLGPGPIRCNAVEPDMYRSFGFPGADEMGNMFQVYRDFAKEVLAARSVETARKLDPQLQTFDQFLAKHKAKLQAALAPVPAR